MTEYWVYFHADNYNPSVAVMPSFFRLILWILVNGRNVAQFLVIPMGKEKTK